MRMRLRGAYSPEQLADLYSIPHEHSTWPDHRARVRATIALARYFEDVRSIADLSAGDAVIINALKIEKKFIGDFAPAYEFVGGLEKTIHEIPFVDLFICSETIEHVDDPDAVLRLIRAKCKYLVLSTPDGEDNPGNPQHYWGWNKEDMHEMLVSAGFTPVIYTGLEFTDPGLIYDYQIWGCK